MSPFRVIKRVYVLSICATIMHRCYAQFNGNAGIELTVAVYPELAEGSLTCTSSSLCSHP